MRCWPRWHPAADAVASGDDGARRYSGSGVASTSHMAQGPIGSRYLASRERRPGDDDGDFWMPGRGWGTCALPGAPRERRRSADAFGVETAGP